MAVIVGPGWPGRGSTGRTVVSAGIVVLCVAGSATVIAAFARYMRIDEPIVTVSQ